MNVKKTAGSTDVARLAGVSRSAVSRTFTDGAYVSAATREKVLAAAKLLNYSPNALARSLSKRSSRLVGIVASNLENPFYARMLEELSSLLQIHGYAGLLLVGASSELDELLPKLLAYQVDGVLLPAATLTSRMAITLVQSGKPVVLVNRYLSHDVATSVSGDNRGGGRAVAELLASTGHRRIAFMAGQDDTSSSRDRGEGLVEGLASAGLPVYARESGRFTHEHGLDAARRLMALTPPPDAIFCANDEMAIAALEVVRVECKLRVPEDVSIVGYDNSAPSSWPLHQLTTVDQNLSEMARRSVEVLLAKILSGENSPAEHVVVSAQLIERSTTRRRHPA